MKIEDVKVGTKVMYKGNKNIIIKIESATSATIMDISDYKGILSFVKLSDLNIIIMPRPTLFDLSEEEFNKMIWLNYEVETETENKIGGMLI